MSELPSLASLVAPDSLDALEDEERGVDFDSFGHLDAWRVGSIVVERALERGLAVTAAVWLGDQRVFHAALPGTSADNDQWMERKAALVRRYGVASLSTRRRFHSYGVTTELPTFGLDPGVHSLSGGGFPIRVRGTMVGVAVGSGVDDDTDHALVVEALRIHLRRGSGAP